MKRKEKNGKRKKWKKEKNGKKENKKGKTIFLFSIT